jgi:phosphatidylserine decarboxylase|tara:strand:- start:208 stop:900 length:693 start_codon:yes stop_codon:yes gene_type:complete
MNMLNTFIKPMHREGIKFILIFSVISLILFFIYIPLGWVGIGLTIWCYYFFRDPKRTIPVRDGLLVSPADGVISLIEKTMPPPELDIEKEELTRISVFMNVFNCHVNRSPIAGKVMEINYRPGKFFNASLDKASVDNERNSLVLQIPDGRQIVVVQIAGLVARRIVSFVKPKQTLRIGQRFGLIRFGSRVDIYLPTGVQPLVCIGQIMVSGETVIADLNSKELARDGRKE